MPLSWELAHFQCAFLVMRSCRSGFWLLSDCNWPVRAAGQKFLAPTYLKSFMNHHYHDLLMIIIGILLAIELKLELHINHLRFCQLARIILRVETNEKKPLQDFQLRNILELLVLS